MQINIEKLPLPTGLYVVATPLGNLKDITLRALETLSSVDFIWCEDKRISVRLLQAYGIQTKLFAYHEHNADDEMPQILAKLEAGASVALISDAGTPLISDPGMKLINACRARNLKLIPIPGCSAPITALCVAGLATNRFLFEGFLPNKKLKKQAVIDELKNIDATLVFFESPKRLLASLELIADMLPDRQVTVARELTKIYEEVITLPAAEIYAEYKSRERIRGEIVLMIGPATTQVEVSQADIDAALTQALAKMRVKEAANFVAEQFGLPKKTLYQRALEIK
ncbi:MAG: 16S rRNA (cytidine(1402)-2'-O)-methyltransferase [Alphaproteobacteria bacterium]|nr:16S rRNA (cytidine(1402)-2'-O)-methyltransferase [Alphaproteobacteria bacterium]